MIIEPNNLIKIVNNFISVIDDSNYKNVIITYEKDFPKRWSPCVSIKTIRCGKYGALIYWDSYKSCYVFSTQEGLHSLNLTQIKKINEIAKNEGLFPFIYKSYELNK